MATLYDITSEFQELYELAEEEDVGMDTINDTFESLSFEFEEKAEAYAVVMRTLQTEAEGLEKEIKRLKARKETLENNAERIKKSVEKAMIETGKRKFNTKLFGFNIQKNAPSLGEVNEALVGEKYWIPQDPKLDRTKLLADVKADPEAFAGIASLKQTESIRIR